MREDQILVKSEIALQRLELERIIQKGLDSLGNRIVLAECLTEAGSVTERLKDLEARMAEHREPQRTFAMKIRDDRGCLVHDWVITDDTRKVILGYLRTS